VARPVSLSPVIVDMVSIDASTDGYTALPNEGDLFSRIAQHQAVGRTLGTKVHLESENGKSSRATSSRSIYIRRFPDESIGRSTIGRAYNPWAASCVTDAFWPSPNTAPHRCPRSKNIL
jgi:hypothetical protein